MSESKRSSPAKTVRSGRTPRRRCPQARPAVRAGGGVRGADDVPSVLCPDNRSFCAARPECRQPRSRVSGARSVAIARGASSRSTSTRPPSSWSERRVVTLQSSSSETPSARNGTIRRGRFDVALAVAAKLRTLVFLIHRAVGFTGNSLINDIGFHFFISSENPHSSARVLFVCFQYDGLLNFLFISGRARRSYRKVLKPLRSQTSLF